MRGAGGIILILTAAACFLTAWACLSCAVDAWRRRRSAGLVPFAAGAAAVVLAIVGPGYCPSRL